MSIRKISLACAMLGAFALSGCPTDPVVVEDAGTDARLTDTGPRVDARVDGGPGTDTGPGTDAPAIACGDGVVNGTETCDDDNTAADDGCSATCTVETGWTCDDADPSLCTETCGDGDVVGDEGGTNGCDDGGTTAGDGCSTTCVVETGFSCTGEPSVCTPGCGDGLILGGEECDDDDNDDDDGCSAACVIEHGFDCTTPAAGPSVCTSTCGDGEVASDEACDDSGTTEGDGCADNCTIEGGYACTGEPSTCVTVCGDGVIVGLEDCDDNNMVTETCAYGTASCTVCDMTCHNVAGATSVCGDGTFDAANEACDDMNTNTETVCPYGMATCTGCDATCDTMLALTGNVCGDGNVDATNEECDDSNTASGDGCSATCEDEQVCGNGVIEAPEACDDGNIVTETCAYGATSCTVCNNVCASVAGATAVCGDGVINASGGETCDDMNTVRGDGCHLCRADLTEIEPNEDGTPSLGGSGTTGNDFAIASADANFAALPFRASLGYGLVSAAYATAGDEDVFAVENDTTGDVILRFDTWKLGTGFGVGVACGAYMDTVGETAVHIRNAAGTSLFNNDDRVSGTDVCSGGNFGLAPGQRVYIHVIDFNDNTALTTGYALEVSFTPVVCGNGTRTAPETCDDGNTTATDGCSATCRAEPGFTCTTATPNVCTRTCGNGAIVAPETCDDGNFAAGDGCSNACIIEAGYVCTGTPSVCTLACGNGALNAGEACDDGNAATGDGCAACAFETGYYCVGQPSMCSMVMCGNSTVDRGEGCDPPGATCSARCATPIAAPGASVVLTGSVDVTDPTYVRTNADCTARTSATPHAYDTYVIENTGTTARTLTLTSTYAGADGYLFVYGYPFSPAQQLFNCRVGDDDFGTGNGSQITGLTIAPGERLFVIATSFTGGGLPGATSITVATN